MKEGIKAFIFIIFLLLSFSQATARIRPYWELKFSDIDKQSAEFSCGVAVLATLFTYYYGIPIKEEGIMDEFFKKMMEEKRGISFLDMKRFALSKGFGAEGYKLNFAGLLELLKANL
ncbi:MAG: cysteine peptidase family C39 domain-containing protein, partial [Candidatus Desantisbacteria bacterium]